MVSGITFSCDAPSARRRGAMLIIAITFLTLLSLLGVTFAALMKLERKATRNYMDLQTADMAVHSAVDAVSSRLCGAMNYYHYTSFHAPWLFKGPQGRQMGAGRYMIEEMGEEDLFFQGILEPVEGVARISYKAKVIDCASQINLNCGMDNLAMMLDSLGSAIESTHGTNPLYSGRRRVRGTEIVRYRRKLEKERFESKSQLIELIGKENYELIADYVTAHSWVNKDTGKPQDGISVVRREEGSGSNSSSSARFRGTQYEDMGHPAIYGSHVPVTQPRAPVNINTAPLEVLIACLTGVACRRPFPYVERAGSKIGRAELQAGFAPEGSDQFPNAAAGRGGGKEEINYTVRPVWVYTPRITIVQAKKIAEAIISQRKRTPFVCWKSSQGLGGGFADFINQRLRTTFLPRPNEVVVIDPFMPRLTNYQGVLRRNGSGNPALASLWAGGHSPMERSLRRQNGLPFHSRNAWFYETMKAGIIANFNPNARLNRYGYNVGACLPVDKTCLISPWMPRGWGRTRPSRGAVYCAHTTEFCFDSGGFYEVIALAELDERYDPAQGLVKPKVYRKARSVVKVFDVAHHTTQYDFAKQFDAGRYNSRRGRSNGRLHVMTYPSCLISATDYVSSGSTVDGSIQLMGNIDSQKTRMPAASRDGFYSQLQNVLFANGFMYRTSREESRYLRLVQEGIGQQGADYEIGGGLQPGGAINQFDRLLQSVLDGDFARQAPAFRRRFTMAPDRQGRNGALNGSNVPRVIQYPRLSESFLEGDNLRPDGLHTNILNYSTRACGIAMYPASAKPTGSDWFVGEHGPFSVDSNRMGNVDYYEGGVAFWIRFDFDAEDPVFCGLVGCTQVVSDVGENPNSSEGNQFYIFKTSYGELRVVRMYYHRAFGCAEMHGSTGLLPRPPREGEQQQGDRETEIEPDPNKAYARSEVLVDISGWKKGEWHHVAVYWNDLGQGRQRVKAYVDMSPAETASGGVTYGTIGEHDFVNLNTKVPYDELTVGGIIRRQADAQAGVFKFSYNLHSATGGGTRAGTFYAPYLKVFPANATIDEFVSFRGNFENLRSTALGSLKGYYAREPGRYHNCFDVTLPTGVNAVRLRSFTWTEYQPPFFHTATGPVPLDTTAVKATVYPGNSQPVNFSRAPWLVRSAVAQNRIAGRVLMRPTGQGVRDRAVKVGYRFTITPARVRSGNLAGVPVATPTIDDVTLTYFLPSPQVVIWEDEPVDYDALSGRPGTALLRRGGRGSTAGSQ